MIAACPARWGKEKTVAGQVGLVRLFYITAAVLRNQNRRFHSLLNLLQLKKV
jgi:hypothetical protein